MGMTLDPICSGSSHSLVCMGELEPIIECFRIPSRFCKVQSNHYLPHSLHWDPGYQHEQWGSKDKVLVHVQCSAALQSSEKDIYTFCHFVVCTHLLDTVQNVFFAALPFLKRIFVALCLGPVEFHCTQMSQFGLTAGWTISRKTRDPGVHPHDFPNCSCLEFSGTAMGSLCWDSVALRWQLDKYMTSRGPRNFPWWQNVSVNNRAERCTVTSSRDFHVYLTCLISQSCLHTGSSAW